MGGQKQDCGFSHDGLGADSCDGLKLRKSRMSPFLPSTERDFISVTTANLSHDQLQQLSDEVGGERSLLVVCSAFRGRKDGYGNLTVKKIPKAVLSRCEWGKDDYSLKVESLPKAPPPLGQMELLSVEGD